MKREGKRRWVKWVIWTPVALGLVGLVALLATDRRISEEIRLREDRLLAMDVDIRQVRPEDDAIEAYNDIAIEVAPTRYAFSESVLQKLEEAAKKPIATNVSMAEDLKRQREGSALKPGDPFSAISMWIEVASRGAAAKHDWKRLDRLFDLYCRIQIQCLASGADPVAAAFFVDGCPLWNLSGADSEVRAWLRKRLESYDVKALALAKLSGLGRMATKAETSNQRTKQPWLKRFVESQTAFQKRAKLTFLNEWIPLVTQRLAEPYNPKGLRQSILTLHGKLSRSTDWPTTWAASRMSTNIAYSLPELFVNTSLVSLDLLEQRKLGKPLKPTWSKRYLFDPETGEPFMLTFTKERLILTSTSKGNAWTVHEPW